MHQEQVLGLDIGSASVKAVQLHKDKSQYTVAAAGIANIKPAHSGKEQSDITVIRAIKNCIGSMSARTQQAVCGVSGSDVAVRTFKFPSLPMEEIQGAVMLEASQVCPFNINESIVDYQLIPNGAKSVQGVLVAATEKLVRKKNNLAEQAFVKSVLMDVDGLALINCFKEWEKPQAGKTIAILNVGYSYTTLVIIGKDNLPFIRDIAYAGNDIIEEIAAQKGIDAQYVREQFLASETADKFQKKMAGSLAQASKGLIDNVSETLRYYVASDKKVVDQIYVCGGFALVKGFPELLNSKFTTNVALWNPFEKIPCQAGAPCGEIVQNKGPALAVAAGLAMRSI